MAYVTISALSARLGTPLYARLTDRANGNTANDTVAQTIVDDAEAEANSYLARRFATPVDLGAHPELAAVLAARVLDLAEHAAWRGSPFVSDPPQRVQRLYGAAVAWLESVAQGRVQLPAAGVPASTQATDEGPKYRGAQRAFTAEELDGL